MIALIGDGCSVLGRLSRGDYAHDSALACRSPWAVAGPILAVACIRRTAASPAAWWRRPRTRYDDPYTLCAGKETARALHLVLGQLHFQWRGGDCCPASSTCVWHADAVVCTCLIRRACWTAFRTASAASTRARSPTPTIATGASCLPIAHVPFQ